VTIVAGIPPHTLVKTNETKL
jgi:hypothetical protein